MDKLRPAQVDVLEYSSGRMGISAVPGSGKTLTLSHLAARIIDRGGLADDQEVLVVTLVNSAVDNFYQRVRKCLEKGGRLPFNYRVRTLHGLAHDIVRERPDLAGLSDEFQIIDEREANKIRDEAAQAWLHGHPYDLMGWLNPELDEGKRDWVMRKPLPELIRELALSFIRYAKDKRLTPELLGTRLEALQVPLPLADMGCAIFQDYQRALAYRGAVDFDDLIRLALQTLEGDAYLLARLRNRWPYILEDESQDSSQLQQQILELLVGPQGNWVRVGDPNQAIYETFTTASPKYLKEFVRTEGVLLRELPNSGRSTQSIIDLANYLVRWTQTEHPMPEARDALTAPPFIEPTPEGDPQLNPLDNPAQVRLDLGKYTPQEEIQVVVASLVEWLPENPQATVAILVLRNDRGSAIVEELRKRNLPVVDSLLRSSISTRMSARILDSLLSYLADPGSAGKLAAVYKAWRRADQQEASARKRLEEELELLRKCGQVEDYLWPRLGKGWLEDISLAAEDPELYHNLVEFRDVMRRWQGAILLPVDQLLLTLSREVFTEPAELAVSHKFAVLLRQANELHPDWHLPELTQELGMIARNERRFLGFGEEDTGFDTELYKGKVVVATMHKAKGLEWDRVYLTSVNNYDFPSGMEFDAYIPEKWFIRDKLNLEAETLAQLETAVASGEYTWYEEGKATLDARTDSIRERLRLLYVGITRAKKELVITWNTGHRGVCKPAAPLVALQAFWERHLNETTA